MLAASLADLVLLAHLAFILFVSLGALLVLRWRRLAWLHLPMVAWSSIVNLTPWRCPLTPLENSLRTAAGEAGYEGGFIAHYITPLIYPAGIDWDMGLLIGIGIFAWNALLYGIILHRWRHTRLMRR